jgi:hypothetical protein
MREMARRLGTDPGQYRPWEVKDAAPAMITLKQAYKRLGVWGWKDLVIWLADGEDDPPRWLKTPWLDPFKPPKPDEKPGLNEVVVPRSTIKAFGQAYSELELAREAGELRAPPALRAWTALDQARVALPQGVAHIVDEALNAGRGRGSRWMCIKSDDSAAA